MEERKLSQLQMWGSIPFQQALRSEIEDLEEWLEWPERWLLITGTVGLGKTHMLQSLAQELAPWSLYITAGDFEGKVFQGLDRSNRFTVEEFIFVLSHAPFLFYDDLGAMYGSPFPQKTLRRVIDYRYSRPSEYVTVIASNLNATKPNEFIEYDVRMADRIMDKHICDVLEIRYDSSWRTDGNDTV
jgi:DNA replication protein DnaC